MNAKLLSSGWSCGQLVKVGVLALTLTLAACGGGSSSSSNSVADQIKALVALGTAADFEKAEDLLVNNQDSLSAADFENLMALISQS